MMRHLGAGGRRFESSRPEPFPGGSLARRDFGSKDPSASGIQSGGLPGSADGIYATVVGVANLRSAQLDAPAQPEVFTPYTHAVPLVPTFVVRTTWNPTAVASAVRASLVAIDRGQDVAQVTTLEQALAESIAPVQT